MSSPIDIIAGTIRLAFDSEDLARRTAIVLTHSRIVKHAARALKGADVAIYGRNGRVLTDEDFQELAQIVLDSVAEGAR